MMRGTGVNGSKEKENKKRIKKTGFEKRHYELKRDKKRKMKKHNTDEINIPIVDNNVPLDLTIKKNYSDEDDFYTDVEPNVSSVQANEHFSLPLDLRKKSHNDTTDDEQNLLFRKPPPLVPINNGGNWNHCSGEKRYENIKNVTNNNDKMYCDDQPQDPGIIVKEKTSFEAKHMSTSETGSANTVVFKEEKVVRECFFVEVKFQSQLVLSLPIFNVFQNKSLSPSLGPKIVQNKKSRNCQQKKSNETSASSSLVQTRETAAGNVGVFRTFRNLKKFDSHRKETKLRKKSTKSNNREKLT